MMSRSQTARSLRIQVDGRRPEEVRKIRCRMGLFGRADGSAYLEQGNTKAIAVVYGPKELTRRSDASHERHGTTALSWRGEDT